MLGIILFSVVLAAAGAGVFLYFHRAGQAKDQYLCFRCAHCQQKIRYLTSKAGRGGMCPRCGQRWTLPTESHAAPYTMLSPEGYAVKVSQKRFRIRSVGTRFKSDSRTP